MILQTSKVRVYRSVLVCYKCTTVCISCTNTGLYTLTLLARFPIHPVHDQKSTQRRVLRKYFENLEIKSHVLVLLQMQLYAYLVPTQACTLSLYFPVFIYRLYVKFQYKISEFSKNTETIVC